MLMRYSFDSQRLLTRSLITAVLAAMGIIFGVIPDFSPSLNQFSFNPLASAQDTTNISEREVRNYAEAILAIEPLRQQTYADIKKRVGNREVPNIVCYQRGSIDELPSNIRDIAANFCNQSREIVVGIDPNFTVERFNEITRAIQTNSQLKNRVQNALIQLQQRRS